MKIASFGLSALNSNRFFFAVTLASASGRGLCFSLDSAGGHDGRGEGDPFGSLLGLQTKAVGETLR